MVDSISGGAAAPVRSGLQQVGQRDATAAAAPVRVEPSSQPVSPAAVEGIGAGVSQLRELGASPPVDGAKVADLKARLASGSYKLDPEATAAAMIRSELGGSSS